MQTKREHFVLLYCKILLLHLKCVLYEANKTSFVTCNEKVARCFCRLLKVRITPSGIIYIY